MKTYALAINSLVFLASLLISAAFVYSMLAPETKDLEERLADSFRLINSGTIVSTTENSFIFSYTFEDRAWSAEIRITDDTALFSSKPLIRDGVIYGRDVEEVPRSVNLSGRRAVVDWEYHRDKDYVAREIILIPAGAETILY